MDIIFYSILGLCMLTLIGLISQAILSIYRKTLRYETFPDTAIVCSKKYEGEYFIHYYYHNEEYNVYLMHQREKHCFDNKDLYNQVNVGDVIHVLVHKGYNKLGEVKHVYLSIED